MKTRSAGRKRRMLVLRNGSGSFEPADFDAPGESRLMGSTEATAEVIEFARACGLHRPVQLVLNQFAEGEPAVHRLERPFVLIGRAADCDVRLRHPEVSYRHAYLQIVGGRALCVDLASRTGTRWKTGTQAYGWIEPGEDVGVGPFELSYRGEDTDNPGFSEEAGILTEAGGSAAQAAVPAAALEFLNGREASDTPRVWPLRRNVSLVGASAACNVQLRHESVSKVHSSLVLTPAGLWAVDLLGRHGTRVNGTAVRCARLGDGDELQIGRFRMVVRLGTATHQQVTSEGALARIEQPARKTSLARPAAPEAGGILAPASQPPAGTVSPPKPCANADVPAGERMYSEAFILRLMDQFAAMQQQAMAQSQQQMMMMVQLFSSMHESQQELIREELDRVHQINRRLQELQSELARQQTAQHLTQHAAPAEAAKGEPSLSEEAAPRSETAETSEISVRPGDTSPAEPSVTAPVASASPPDTRTREGAAEPAEEITPSDAPEVAEVSSDVLPGAAETAEATEDKPDAPPVSDVAADEGPSAELEDGTPAVPHPDADAHAWLAEQIHRLEREREGRWRKVLRMVGAGRL